jgi:hypothetical protein
VIGVTSVEGSGSTFSFSIPFPVVKTSESKAVLADQRIDSSERIMFQTNRNILNHGTYLESSDGADCQRGLLIVDIESPRNVTQPVVPALKVLVVDDADSNRKMLVMLLTKRGIYVYIYINIYEYIYIYIYEYTFI